MFRRLLTGFSPRMSEDAAMALLQGGKRPTVTARQATSMGIVRPGSATRYAPHAPSTTQEKRLTHDELVEQLWLNASRYRD